MWFRFAKKLWRTPEAEAVAAVAGTPAEPEVAKKGKTDAAPDAAAGKKPEAGAKK